MTVAFPSASCEDIAAEITARVNGESGWYDPHNRGKYSIESTSSGYLKVRRTTGDGKYTDLMDFTMTASGSGCSIDACSESQVVVAHV